MRVCVCTLVRGALSRLRAMDAQMKELSELARELGDRGGSDVVAQQAQAQGRKKSQFHSHHEAVLRRSGSSSSEDDR